MTHADDAFKFLKRAILICEPAPGQELRELGLVQSTGLSRGVVRGALGRLVSGLVDLRPRRGTGCPRLPSPTSGEVFEMRRLPEPYAVELSAQRVPREAAEALHDLVHGTYDLADWTIYEQ